MRPSDPAAGAPGMMRYHFPPHMHRTFAAILATAVILTGCSDRGKNAAVDSELAHDIALANQRPPGRELNHTALAPPSPRRRAAATRPSRTPPPTRVGPTRRNTPAAAPAPRRPRPAPVEPAPVVEAP